MKCSYYFIHEMWNGKLFKVSVMEHNGNYGEKIRWTKKKEMWDVGADDAWESKNEIIEREIQTSIFTKYDQQKKKIVPL